MTDIPRISRVVEVAFPGMAQFMERDFLKKLAADLREAALHVSDGSGYYCEAPMGLLERAAVEIDRMAEEADLRAKALRA